MSLNVTADVCEKETADAETPMKGHLLETEDDKRIRMKSLKIIYFTMFLMTLGFSIILTGIWPYLDKVGLHIRMALK
jgi:hypothetical protein